MLLDVKVLTMDIFSKLNKGSPASRITTFLFEKSRASNTPFYLYFITAGRVSKDDAIIRPQRKVKLIYTREGNQEYQQISQKNSPKFSSSEENSRQARGIQFMSILIDKEI